MSQYLLAIDQGTTGTKVLLMNTDLEVVAEKSTSFEQYFPQSGWVEHDLDQIWNSVVAGIEFVTLKVDPKKILAIGITNQRETIGFWQKQTLKPLYRAIVWQDRRTASRCAELKQSGMETQVQDQTGLLLDPYFSASKIEWAIKNVPAVAQAQKSDELAVGTIDTYLLARLTHGRAHATETSNASRTMLMGLESLTWNRDLSRLFGIAECALPQILPSFGEFGKTSHLGPLPDGIPITGIIGDQQSALLGQACVLEGQAKCTYGTGAFLLMNTGSKMRKSRHRLLTTVAWTDQQKRTTYALEGSAFMAGATIQWLRDGIKIISQSDQVEGLARSVSDSGGVYFVPSFTGMGAPHWDPGARALICGISRGTTQAHIARAALEGVAFQNAEILQAMEKDLGGELKALSVDGGACKNNLLMQIQSDFLGRKLLRPVLTETTSLGAIFAAGLGAGVWSDLNQIKKAWKLDQEFNPEMSPADRSQALLGWQKAVERAKS
jgi:glycerol kinase